MLAANAAGLDGGNVALFASLSLRPAIGELVIRRDFCISCAKNSQNNDDVQLLWRYAARWL